jgi:hypothetical protein
MAEEQLITIRKIIETPTYQDSIEIGTPGKGGAIKVYGDFGDPEDFEKRITEAVRLRKAAVEMMEGGRDFPA